MNAHTPLITISLPQDAKTTVSFTSGSVGAWSAIYGDTQLVNGQVSNTWAEYTMSETGVVDVSREANMDGHTMSVVGPSCTTDMDRCVFVCSSGNVCMTGYVLQACEVRAFRSFFFFFFYLSHEMLRSVTGAIGSKDMSQDQTFTGSQKADLKLWIARITARRPEWHRQQRRRLGRLWGTGIISRSEDHIFLGVQLFFNSFQVSAIHGVQVLSVGGLQDRYFSI